MRRVVRLAGLAVAALAYGAPLRAQDARLAVITDTDARAAIGAMLVAADRAGLPREPLVTKALEGVEKRAPAPRIEAAVRALAERLSTARLALGPLATADELRAGADALAAGISAAGVRSIRAAAPNQSAAVALGVAAQLAARRVPPDQSATTVATLVGRGAGHSQLLALQRSVQEDLAANVPPGSALELRAKNVIMTLPPPTGGRATLTGGKP